MGRAVSLPRRAFVATSAAVLAQPVIGRLALAQTPRATPAPDQIALYADVRDALLAEGRAVMELVLAGDDAAVVERATPEMRGAFSQVSVSGLMASLQVNRVRMEAANGRAHFDGGYDGTTTMTGFYSEVGSGQFSLAAEGEQGGPAPSGRWNGVIVPGNVAFSVVFTGSEVDLAATLDIPEIGLVDDPMSNVEFVAEQPIGERVQERALPLRPDARSYTAAYAWGTGHLEISASFNVSDQLNGLSLLASWPLPDDPAGDYESTAMYRLPVDEQVFVMWGGDTVLQNYHAAYPNQRHALDLLQWADGATFIGIGARNEDYLIWGAPVVAPVAGTVVAVANDEPDIAPGQLPSATGADSSSAANPLGNHVIIEVAEEEFVMIGHMQRGSVSAHPGDVVRPGDPVGKVGNSGNTTEPHVHIQAQNRADLTALDFVCLPLAFTNVLVDDAPVDQAAPVQGQFIEQS